MKIKQTKSLLVKFYLRYWNCCLSLEQQAERDGISSGRAWRCFCIGRKLHNKETL